MNNLLDDYALASPLRHHSNWLKLAIVAFGLLVGVSSPSPVTPIFITLSMGFATVFFGKIPLKFYLKLVLLPLGFAVTGSIVILFFFGTGCEVFSFEILGYRLVANAGGVEMALLVISRTVSGMSCVFFLALSTPMIELFAVVKRSGIPDSVVELSMLMYRYIFLFLDVAMSIKNAQTIRLGYTNFRRSFYSIAMLASTLFIRSWEQGEKLYIAMDSRCYDGKLTVFEAKRPIRAPEAVLASVYAILAIALLHFTGDAGVI